MASERLEQTYTATIAELLLHRLQDGSSPLAHLLKEAEQCGIDAIALVERAMAMAAESFKKDHCAARRKTFADITNEPAFTKFMDEVNAAFRNRQ